MENPIKMDDLGVFPLFLETPTWVQGLEPHLDFTASFYDGFGTCVSSPWWILPVTTFRWGVVGGEGGRTSTKIPFCFYCDSFTIFFLKGADLYSLPSLGGVPPTRCCVVLFGTFVPFGFYPWKSVANPIFFQECSVTSFVACQGLLMATWSANWSLVNGCPGTEVRINGYRINGLFHLLINGVYWGYNPLILTIDPNFLGHPSRDC